MFEGFSLEKAVFSGLAYYVLTLFAGILTAWFVPVAVSYVWWVASVVFMIVVMKFIYKPVSGLEMGIVFFVATLVIEIPLLVFGFGMGWVIYAEWTVWVQYALTVVTPLVAVRFIGERV